MCCLSAETNSIIVCTIILINLRIFKRDDGGFAHVSFVLLQLSASVYQKTLLYFLLYLF